MSAQATGLGNVPCQRIQPQRGGPNFRDSVSMTIRKMERSASNWRSACEDARC